MTLLHLLAVLLASAVPALGAPPPAAGQEASGAVLRRLLAAARIPGAQWPDFARYVDDVTRLYDSRGYAPVWFAGTRLSAHGHVAVGALLDAASHGLVPQEYDAAALDSLTRGSGPHP